MIPIALRILFCRQRQHVTNIRQASGQLLLLVREDRFYRLIPFKRGSPVPWWSGIGLNQAQHPCKLSRRTRWISGPIIISQHSDVASFQCPEFNGHGYIWTSFRQDTKQGREVDNPLPKRTANKTISLLTQIDTVVL